MSWTDWPFWQSDWAVLLYAMYFATMFVVLPRSDHQEVRRPQLWAGTALVGLLAAFIVLRSIHLHDGQWWVVAPWALILYWQARALMKSYKRDAALARWLRQKRKRL